MILNHLGCNKLILDLFEAELLGINRSLDVSAPHGL